MLCSAPLPADLLIVKIDLKINFFVSINGRECVQHNVVTHFLNL